MAFYKDQHNHFRITQVSRIRLRITPIFITTFSIGTRVLFISSVKVSINKGVSLLVFELGL